MPTPQLLTTHAAVRCEPEPGGSEAWMVTQLLAKRRLRLSGIAVGVLLAFAGTAARSVEEAVRTLTGLTDVPALRVRDIIAALREAELLVPEGDVGHERIRAMAARWADRGWAVAFDHHLATFDYPYLDYTSSGTGLDRQRMTEYAVAEPYRRPRPHHPTIGVGAPLPVTTDALGDLRGSIQEALRGPVGFGVCDLASVSTVLAASCGYLNPPGQRGRTTRTSPSGGARHPTEAYLVAIDVASLSPGVFHVVAEDRRLRRVRDLPDIAALPGLFPGLYMARFTPRALVVLTSLFDRNAYRYREPRTLRTLFMDAGHLAATVETSAHSIGLCCHLHHGLDDAAVEDLLGLAALDQGVIAGAALADGTPA